MEARLRKNDHKGKRGWKEGHHAFGSCLGVEDRIQEALTELHNTDWATQAYIDRTADVANFAMMAADCFGNDQYDCWHADGYGIGLLG